MDAKISRKPYCLICNKEVEVLRVNELPGYWETIFSCNHSSKLFKRTISEGFKITEGIEIAPNEGEKIPVAISGDTGIKMLQGDLNRINVSYVEHKPTYINLSITNIGGDQNISQTNTISNIMTYVDQMSLTIDVKNEVKGLILEFDQETKQVIPNSVKV